MSIMLPDNPVYDELYGQWFVATGEVRPPRQGEFFYPAMRSAAVLYAPAGMETAWPIMRVCPAPTDPIVVRTGDGSAADVVSLPRDPDPVATATERRGDGR